jgi:hypothetical protein
VSDVHERTERATRIDLSALAPQHACTLAARFLSEVPEDSGLADAGLAGDQYGLSVPLEALAE